MFYVHFTDANAKERSNFYTCEEKYFRDTFSPETQIHCIIDFRLHGKTYAERKESLRNVAVNFSMSQTPGLSYGELANIAGFFVVNARRYGLLTEFKENGIC